MIKRIYLKRLIYILIIAIIVIFAGFYLRNKNPQENSTSETTKNQVIKKTVETISFGNWQPDNYRKVLGTVQSSSDIDIYSDLSGKIAQVFVDIGDTVSSGEIVAKFSRENDLSQISYENALNSLENAKMSAENSVRSAEIALDNAQNDLEQLITLTDQNKNQTFTILYTQAKNAETTILNSINWADRLFGVSRNVKYAVDPRGGKIGRNNTILKNRTRNSLQELVREIENSRDLYSYEKNDKEKVLDFSRKKMNNLKNTQEIIRNIDQLIRESSTNSSFLVAEKLQIIQEVEVIAAKIDGNVVSLESQIEASKSGDEQINSNVLAAKNRVISAESSLNLAKSSANNQISGAENQINIASKSIKDFEVRAPFTGKISAKFVNDFDRVNPGQKLFSIVSENSSPEIVTYLTSEEINLLSDLEKIKIESPSGKNIAVESVGVSGKLDSVSQKMEANFQTNLNSEELLVGSIVNILLPVNNGTSNLIPISAISFEPDGAEVFIVNSAKKIERRKVQTGKIVSNAVEILSGLESDENLARYRNRVNAGDEVIIK